MLQIFAACSRRFSCKQLMGDYEVERGRFLVPHFQNKNVRDNRKERRKDDYVKIIP